MRVKILL